MNMAAVYSDRGYGLRPPVVFYNRSNEAAAQLKTGDFDWKAIFAGGVRWVHCGGLFAALSFSGPFIYLLLQRKAEAVLLKEQKRYQQTLLQASRGMTLILRNF